MAEGKKKILNRDQKSGIFIFIFSIFLYFYLIPNEVKGKATGGMKPSFIPDLLAIILAFLSLLLIFEPFIRSLKTKEKIFINEQPIKIPSRTIVVSAIFFAYIFITPFLGYLLSSFLILAILLFYFGNRKWYIVIPLIFVFPLMLYWFFAKVMLVLLPQGRIFY
ncbi:MAG: hypothetical protein DRG20_01955 [Deltaproteobacteria bacterium]|nr:tripartite tricarboxylate transporter TctB family protein [Deltaproteobacteria bacterium]RLA91228.1 MAG: hypothetical protein DRG20_01955 [Deltaproteobacteria bacterium]